MKLYRSFHGHTTALWVFSALLLELTGTWIRQSDTSTLPPVVAMVNAYATAPSYPVCSGVETTAYPLASLKAFRGFATTTQPDCHSTCQADAICRMQKALIQSNGTPANKEMQLAYLLTFVQREFLGYISTILPGARVVQHLDYAQLVQQPDYHPLLSVAHTQPDLCIAELYLKRLSGLLQQFNPGKTRLANIAHGYFDQLVAREYGTSVVNRTLRSGVVHAFAYTVLPRLLIYGAIKDQRVAVIARVLAVVYAALPTRSLIVVETLLLVAQAQPSGFQDLLVTWRSVVSDDLVLSCAAALGFDQGYQALTTVWQVEATRTPTAAMGCHLFFHCSAQFAQLIKPNQPLLIPVSE